jgi:hypothetical protein
VICVTLRSAFRITGDAEKDAAEEQADKRDGKGEDARGLKIGVDNTGHRDFQMRISSLYAGGVAGEHDLQFVLAASFSIKLPQDLCSEPRFGTCSVLRSRIAVRDFVTAGGNGPVRGNRLRFAAFRGIGVNAQQTIAKFGRESVLGFNFDQVQGVEIQANVRGEALPREGQDQHVERNEVSRFAPPAPGSEDADPQEDQREPGFCLQSHARSVRAAPLRKCAEGVDIIVDDIGVRVFLPAAQIRALEKVARTALLVDGVEGEIQGLAGFTR